jgi:hypothetical protein
MEAPIFKVGMLFSSMEEFRRALNSYSVNERLNTRKTRNEATRLHAMCEGFHKFGCPGRLRFLRIIRRRHMQSKNTVMIILVIGFGSSRH